MNKETKEKLEYLGFLVIPSKDSIILQKQNEASVLIDTGKYDKDALPDKNAYLMALEYEANKAKENRFEDGFLLCSLVSLIVFMALMILGF